MGAQQLPGRSTYPEARMPDHVYAQRPGPPRPVLARAERDADDVVRGGGTPRSSLTHTRTPEDEATDAAEVSALTPTSAGRALDEPTRRQLSASFGFDFGRVRVHRDAAAAELAASARARAYTIGQDVVFAHGHYAPGTPAGRALLTHELSHVVQQSAAGVRVVQRDDTDNPAPAAPSDPELALGQRLVKDFSGGIAVAFYAPMPYDQEAAMGAADAWAKREQALGFKGKARTVKDVAFGQAMSDATHPLVDTVKAIGTVLNAAVAKAAPAVQASGTGPTTIRTLAVFAHGTTDWCGLGAITSSKAASIIKSIAPNLAKNVRVILFSCNAGRSPDESEEWVRGTMASGGAKSLAAVTRDALIAEGKTEGTVWGHTTTGHVTENFALRIFDAGDGKGAEGVSFAQLYVFSAQDHATTAAELLDGIVDAGYQPVNDVKLRRAARTQAELELYAGYASANKELKYSAGGKLAESAPTHPVEVGDQIKQYWDKTYWPAHKTKAVQAFVKRMLANGLVQKPKPSAVP
jgi:hypothetical protein